MKRKKAGLLKTLTAIVALGAMAIAWMIAIEIAVIVVSLVIGIGAALWSGWPQGLLAGILSYLVINKVLWLCDIFEMILSGRERKTEPRSGADPAIPDG